MTHQATSPGTNFAASTKTFVADAPGTSTRHDRVDVFRAEHLADAYPELSAVMIREVFEGEPVKRAVGLILWARKKAPRDPYDRYRKLKAWARRNRRGFYNRAVFRRDPKDDRREYMAYLEKKRVEKKALIGREELLHSEVVALTEEFYAPSYRAELAELAGTSEEVGTS